MITRHGMMQVAATAGLASPARAQRAAPGTLRFVPQANLSVLDPVFTTAAATITHGYCVFDTLYGVDGQMRPCPQMAERHEVSADGRTWLIRLRGDCASMTENRSARRTVRSAYSAGAAATPTGRRWPPPWRRSSRPMTARFASA